MYMAIFLVKLLKILFKKSLLQFSFSTMMIITIQVDIMTSIYTMNDDGIVNHYYFLTLQVQF